MTDVLNERKEKLFEFFLERAKFGALASFLRSKFEWLQYIILALVIWLGWNIREKPISKLIDITTGQYISIELDSTLYLRYAEYIAEHGKIFAMDVLRFFPRGATIDITVFSSYFVGYTYRILHFFGFDGSVALVNNYYPLIAMAVLTVFLFLFVRMMFDWRAGLLSAILINLMPSFLFRSMGGSSDHDILGMMFVVMGFYFYLLALQSKKVKFNVIYGGIAGGIGVLGLMTAGSMNFFFMAASIFILVEILFNKFTKNDFAVLTSFLAVFTFILVGFGFNSLSGLVISFTTGLFYLNLIVGLFYLYVCESKKFSSWLENIKYLRSIPRGFIAFLFCFIFLIGLYTLIFGTGFIASRIQSFSQALFKTFSMTRWVLTVAENRRPYVTDWIGQYGNLMVYAFMLGSVALFYDAVKNCKKAKYLTLSYAVFIFLYVFSRYSGNGKLNGESGLSQFLFFGSLISFILIMFIYYFYSYYSKTGDFEGLTKYDKKHTLLLVWVIIMVLIATSAIRFLFEFSLVVVILSSFFIISLLDFVKNTNNKNWLFIFSVFFSLLFLISIINIKTVYSVLLFIAVLALLVYFLYYNNLANFSRVKYYSIFLIFLILFSPFAFAQGVFVRYYKVVNDTAAYAGPGYNTQWQYAGKWVRENTPKDAVFGHWWDYGYWVQSGFQRATVTDGGNFFGWWNYLMGRNVLTSTTDEEALGYLYAHNVTYLLIVADEIGKYPAYSSIGSDANADRYSFIPTFSLDKDLIRKTRNETLYYFTGGFSLDADLFYQDKILPRGGATIIAVVIPSAPVENVMNFGQPRVVVRYQNQQYELPIRCLYLDSLYTFDKYGYGGCFRMLPVVSGNQANIFAAGMLLSDKVSRGTVGRLYLLNQQSDNFKLVYDDTLAGVPLSIYHGNMIGPIRIWEVKYPKGFTITDKEREYYMLTSYPDLSLLKPF